MKKYFLIFSILTGVISGTFIVLYDYLTKLLHYILFMGYRTEDLDKLPLWYIYLIPLLCILFVNYIISKDYSVKEYGVREIADAIAKNRIEFGIKDLFLKIFASSLSIASGFAVGNEGPSAALGAMIAKKLHTALSLPKRFLKIALSVGASSGIAAIFVSPLTGIVFALENIAYRFLRNYVSYLIIASIFSFTIAWYFLDSIIFNYSQGKFLQYRYIYATLIFIPVITFFIYVYFIFKDIVFNFLNKKISQRFSTKYKNYILSVIGALTISTIMLISPYGVFSGHHLVSILINDKFHLSFGFIFVIIILRIIATTISIYSNAVGGIFITLMSIGALTGYGFGEIMMNLDIHVEPFYFAAIGSAVFMGVVMKLPLTAVILALEITYDYNVVIPTGISVVLASYLTSLKFDIKKLYFKKTETIK